MQELQNIGTALERLLMLREKIVHYKALVQVSLSWRMRVYIGYLYGMYS